jgi:hypothetical protein
MATTGSGSWLTTRSRVDYPRDGSSAGGTTPVRMVIRVVGPDEYVSETYLTLPDGKEFKSMEDRSVRKK